jgi:hypothetical protein
LCVVGDIQIREQGLVVTKGHRLSKIESLMGISIYGVKAGIIADGPTDILELQ